MNYLPPNINIKSAYQHLEAVDIMRMFLKKTLIEKKLDDI